MLGPAHAGTRERGREKAPTKRGSRMEIPPPDHVAKLMPPFLTLFHKKDLKKKLMHTILENVKDWISDWRLGRLAPLCRGVDPSEHCCLTNGDMPPISEQSPTSLAALFTLWVIFAGNYNGCRELAEVGVRTG